MPGRKGPGRAAFTRHVKLRLWKPDAGAHADLTLTSRGPHAREGPSQAETWRHPQGGLLRKDVKATGHRVKTRPACFRTNARAPARTGWCSAHSHRWGHLAGTGSSCCVWCMPSSTALSLAVPAPLDESEEHPSRRHRRTLGDLIPVSARPGTVLCFLRAGRQRRNLRSKNT